MKKNEKSLNIVLVITLFIGLSGSFYWIFGLFNILSVDMIRLFLSMLIALIFGLIIYNTRKQKMNRENNYKISTEGNLASGYLKVRGYVNIIGIIMAFIIGGIMVLVGLLLSFLFGNFFPLTFSGIGLLIIWFGFHGLKASKQMREGKYYHVGKGLVEPA